jgi:hypothetical protein
MSWSKSPRFTFAIGSRADAFIPGSMLSLEQTRVRLSLPGTVAGRARLAFGLSVVVVVLVRVPAILTPFAIDDFAHIAMANGDYPSAHARPFGMYDFIDDSNRSALVERGILPWWTHPNLVCRFFRPLSSLLLFADYRLFGQNAILGHAHSLAWWALASAAVYALLKQSLAQRAARIGAIVFALAPCHVVPLLWLANREALVSTAIGTAAVAHYARWREAMRLRDGAASLALFALAMSAGEYSLCFGGYVLAMEAVSLRTRRESAARRILGTATFLVPTIAYVAARSALHYGTRFGGMYHDPFWDFGRFAHGAAHRLAVVLSMGWLGVDEIHALMMPGPEIAAILVGAAALLVVPIRRAFAQLEPRTRANATWLLMGSLLALLPMLAVEPSTRLLGAAMIGISGLVALVVDRAWFPPVPEPRRGAVELSGLVALALAFVHLARAPLDDLLVTRETTEGVLQATTRMDWVRDHAQGRSSVVIVRAETITTAIWAPFMLGDAKDVRWRVLSYEAGRVLMLRTGERALELVASPRPIFQMGPRQVLRDLDGSLQEGDSVELGGMKATVLQLDKEGMARRVRFEFDRPLDDPSLLWLKESKGGFVEQPLPTVGFGEPIGP